MWLLQCYKVFAGLSQQWVEYMINVVVTVLQGVCWFITTVGGMYDKCGCYSVVGVFAGLSLSVG